MAPQVAPDTSDAGASMDSKRWVVATVVLMSWAAVPSGGAGQWDVPAGKAIDIFPRMGFLGLSMRVLPRNESFHWVFREPSRDVFVPNTYQVQVEEVDRAPFFNEFHIDLCDDLEQLLQAYFRRFFVHGLDRPWRVFVASWSRTAIARHFGLDPSYVRGDYGYMLVRVVMIRENGRVVFMPNVTATDSVQEDISKLKLGNFSNLLSFFHSVGTHFVSAYVTGNSLYQVFVYEPQSYQQLKERIGSTGWRSASYLSTLTYFLPLWVKHTGKVMVGNASPQVTQRIREALNVQFLFSGYPNIFKLHNNAPLVSRLQRELGTEGDALLGLELRNLGVLFRDKPMYKWFVEVLHNTALMWELNA